ncbi:MAG: Uma2 family endonuclease [Deltaproteobacteria bacterium]|nr:Uma2 family endonuclease [Deltaproteobacteria bacterium]
MANAAHRRATRDDFARAIAEGRAVELIAGELIERAAPTFDHGQAQSKVNGQLDAFNRSGGGPRGPGGWWLATEVEVLYPKFEEVFRHDVVGFRRDRQPARPSSFPVEERPDWACEVLSTSTRRGAARRAGRVYDLVKKQRTLHAHGVPHYWLLDPDAEVLTVLRWSEPGYVQILTATVGERVRAEPFDAIELSVSELFGHDE